MLKVFIPGMVISKMNHVSRLLVLALGWILLGIGIVGLFVPLMPTTVFVLMSAFCFCKSSPKIHNWLRNHPRFGEVVCKWEDRGAIHPRIKLIASSAIAGSFGLSVLLMKLNPIVIFLIVFTGGAIIAYIVTRPNE